MAGAAVGRLEAFNEGNESITQYLERVELFFEANGIAAERRKAVFLSVIGRDTYSLLSNLLAPTKPAEMPLNDLMETLRKYFEPKKVVMAARYQFHQRQQQPGESVATYLAELRKMAVPCEFGATLGEALRDRLVCGLGNEAHQKRLLSEPDLTLDKALVLAQSLETADVNAKTLRGHEPALRRLSQGSSRQHSAPSRGKARPSSQQRGRECYRCGSGDHLAANCRFAEFVCRKCNKKGHLARVCHSTKTQSRSRKPPGPEVARAHQLGVAEEDEELPLFVLGASRTTPIQVDVSVNGVPVTMEVDTGAAVSVMLCRQQEELFPAAELQPSRISLRTYTAESVPVLGALPVQVTYGTQSKDLSLVIVQGSGPALLGRDWLSHIKLDWPVIAYHTVDKLKLEEMLQRYHEVFREELGTAKTPAVSLTVKDQS